MKIGVRFGKYIVAAVWLALACCGPAGADAARQADLMAQLRSAENDRAAELVLRELYADWSRSGSPSVDLLLQRGTQALESGDQAAAVEHLTAAIDHAPGFAEAYHQRATAYYLTGDLGPAIADLQMTLALNPDHFGAMQGLAVILQEVGRGTDALAVYRQALALNPRNDDMRDAADRLELDLSGVAL